jgi:hypothetical protein
MSQFYLTFVERVEEELPLYSTTGNSNYFETTLMEARASIPDLCGEDGGGAASLLHYR